MLQIQKSPNQKQLQLRLHHQQSHNITKTIKKIPILLHPNKII
jgi:hypothetical protein